MITKLSVVVQGGLRHIRHVAQRFEGRTYLVALVSFPIILIIMKTLGVGCDGALCSARGFAYAVPLILACVAFGILGAFLSISLNLFNQNDSKLSPPTLALWIALGIVGTMVYIYLRSAFNHFAVEIELTQLELWVWVFIALYFLKRKVGIISWSNLLEKGKRSPLVVQFIAIAALCVVVADREIPRLTMLSSDPDVHAFFARQIQRFGGVPYDQGAWGAEGFNYPAGSGTLVYAWSQFSFMDVRNILAALPVLLTFFSALIVTEQVSVKLRTVSSQLAVQWFALAITAAGFVLPMYDQYSHMEGAGRQLSFAFSALFVVLCIGTISANEKLERNNVLAIALVIFFLTLLNPVNIILPSTFVAGAALYLYLAHRRKPVLLLAPLVSIAMLSLDPYFTGLLGISKPAVAKLELSGGLLVKSPAMWLSDTLGIYQTQFKVLTGHFAALFQFQSFPVFAVLALAFSACAILLSRHLVQKTNWMLVVSILLFSILLLDGAFMAFENDKRFYLLQPYFNVSVGQYKILLLTFIGAWVVMMAFERKYPSAAVFGISICLVSITEFTIGAAQPIRHEPRQAYCGSMGCYEQTDLEVLKQFEVMTASGNIKKIDGILPKVLTPNVVGQFGIEKWIFPASSSRALPFYDVIPAAFYYYQGDSDYTTSAYIKHICDYLDRKWLKEKNIYYVFLPANRNAACIAGMNSLPQSEEIIIKNGETYLLKIR